MFNYSKQEAGNLTAYQISYDLHNGKKDKQYNGTIQTVYFAKFLETKRIEYIQTLVNNYVLHKKTLIQVECKRYEIDTKTLLALDECLLENEIIQQEKSLLTICKRILKIENSFVTLMDRTSLNDADRLTSILAYAKQNSI